MVPINDNTVGVEDEDELAMAVGVSTYDYVYLVNDIEITRGVTIDPEKTSLIIDGEYPINSGIYHRFTDMNSNSNTSTLGVRATSDITITMRNMEINGRNYYGVPYIAQSFPLVIDTSGVSVIYENVTYYGPQITYNCNGFTRYVDCTVTIAQNGMIAPEEFCEVNRVEIGGNTVVNHNSLNSAVFYFNNTATTSSITILAGANVQINSPNSYFMYNHMGLIAYPVALTIQPGASFNLQVNRGMSNSQYDPVSSFLVDENATFNYVQSQSNGSVATLYVSSAIEVRRGARFYMQAASNTQPLLRFTSGTPRTLTVTEPTSFVLYGPNAAAMSPQGTVTFTLRGGQMNTWSTARTPVTNAGGFADRPEYKWFKVNYAIPINFTGSFTGTVTTATGNMEPVDEPHPADTDLHLHSARVLSIGDWPLYVNTVVDDGTPVTGWTDPGAGIQVEYEVEGATHIVEGTAMPSGRYAVSTSQEVPPTIPAGIGVTVRANIPFLIKEIITVSVVEGEFFIQSSPDLITFIPQPILLDPPILPRDDPEFPVVVWDSRAEGTDWELLASIAGPLRSEGGETLPDAMVFIATEGGTPVPLSTEPIVVYTGVPTDPPELRTPVFWPVTHGIMCRLTSPIRSGTPYTTRILWGLRAI